MLKVFGFVRRNARLTHDEYRTAHAGYHNSFGRRLNNIRGYILNVRANRKIDESLGPLANQITKNEPTDFDDLWDGWGQLMFDTLEDYLAAKSPALDRPGPKGLEKDPQVAKVGGDAQYLYSGAPCQFHVSEYIAVPVRRPESKLFKLAQFAKRPDGMALEEFRACWTGIYAALISRIPGLRGHIINFPTSLDVITGFFDKDSDAFTAEGAAYRKTFLGKWDGVAELWFDQPQQFIAARASSEIGKELDKLESRIFDTVFYREVDETVAVLPNRAPAPAFYHR